MLDLLIEGGDVVDGTGAPRRRADVGVVAGRIARIGALGGEAARERIDAGGRIVAPGFIDVHTHDDRLLLEPPTGGTHPKLSQGVTTVVTGNCGISLAPLVAASPPAPLDVLGGDRFRFDSFAAYLDALAGTGPAVNAACLVGHSTLRARHVADLGRAATADECQRMAEDLERALDAGAFGLSTGLYYPPARAATAAEVVAVAAPLRGAGGCITMHIRDEGDAIADAMREAFAIGESLGVATVLSHHKLMGTRNHGRSAETLAMIEGAARLRPVCFDCYPYTASSTMLLASRIAQSRDILVTWSKADPAAAGRSLFEMARERGVSPESLVDALQPAGAIYFAMADEDVDRILGHPLAMIGSDGLAHDAWPHPRLWGTFPRVLGHYVREKKLLSLESAVHKMTALGATRFGLEGRGRLQAGDHADIVVFDESRIADRATFADPCRPSAGIDAVVVNGIVACRDGRTVDGRAGRVLRRGSARATTRNAPRSP